MKISSKSILSPGHSEKSREPTLSFSSSLNRRRLRPNGSISSSSPMFPTGSKKRGCFFDTPEPSSPKVTCIGQVRVNTKKKNGKKKKQQMVASNGDVLSFREAADLSNNGGGGGGGGGGGRVHCLPQRNPKWVHLPFTICEALRSFGADFSCFLPCGGRSCSSMGERDKGEKIRGTLQASRPSTTTTTVSSCGAVFARWLMALHEGDGVEEKRKEMEMVVGEEEEERENKFVVDVMEFDEDDDGDDGEKGEAAGEEEEEIEEDDEEARVSICIPPRNALLLMRCRSDPLRMSALANRFWDSPVTKDDEESEDGDDDDEDEESENGDEDEECEDGFEVEEEMNPDVEENWDLDEETLKIELEQEHVDSVKVGQPQEEDEEEAMVNGFSNEALENPSVEGEQELEEVRAEVVEEEEEEIVQLTQVLDEDEKGEQVGVDDNENEAIVNGGSLEDMKSLRLEEPELQARVTVAEEDVDEEEEEMVDSLEALENPRLEEPELQVRVSGTDEDGEDDENEVAMVDCDEKTVLEDVSSAEAEENPCLEEEEIDECEVEILMKSPAKPPLAEQVAILVLEEIIARLVEDGENEQDEVVEKNDDKHAQVSQVTETDSTTEEEAIHELEVDDKKSEERASNGVQLPDCLLLMLYEPKLSMEVSKETWVCRTDFITRSRPREIVLNNGRDNRSCKKNLLSTLESNAAASELMATPPPSMASMIKQKFVNAVGYEPLVLTRCKSEPPLRSSSPAKLGF